MTTFRDAILPALDVVRGIEGLLGFRLHSVFVRVRTWSGARVGEGAFADVDTPITVAAGTQPVQVEKISQRDIIASGGLYSDQDLKVGPITPRYAGGGFLTTALDPPTTGSPVEVFWNVMGPGMPAAGGWCDKIGASYDANLHYTVVLRRNGKTP